jgi:hypothetical protein
VGTGTTRTSGAQTGSSWTSGDLSLNATYTFTLTPYNQAGIAGTARTMSVDTTPARGGSLSVGTSTTSGTQITWSAATTAGANISYVRIYRQITSPYTGSVEDICAGTYISSSPYYDNDISGNATYTYTVYPYDSAIGALSSAGQTFSVSTTAAAARDLSYTYLDSSSVKISFTMPKNAYSSSYYYQLNAVYSGTTTSVTGTTSPLWVTGLTSDVSYICYIASYLDGSLGATSAGYVVTPTSGKTYSLSFLSSSSIYLYFPLDNNIYSYSNGSKTTTTFTLTDSDSTSDVGFSTTYSLSTRSYSYYLTQTSYVTLSNSFTIDSNGFSVSLWVYINRDQSQFAGNYPLFTLKYSTSDYYTPYIIGGSSLKLYRSGSIYGSTTFTKGQWNHVVLRVTTGSSGVILYLNNSAVTTQTFGTPFNTSYTYTLYLNCNVTNYDMVNAYYSNVLVTKYGLTSTDVYNLYTKYN